MEYVYAALLLHKAGKPVDAESITKIMQASGVEVDESKVKSLVASLKGVDIDKELENAVVASAAPAASGETSKEAPAAEAVKEEPKEAAAEGLSALFG
jgi:large subunit ribosomal protein L12|tara:strand:- start:59 stop:352 length:294 start_codon:yes stop_codon:yes gene_type:complete